jgi:hypothetical protein
MAKTMPDLGMQLFPLTTVSTDVSGTPLLCYPTRWPTVGWIIHVQTALATGGIVWALEIAPTTAGPWAEVTRVAWPAGETRTQVLGAGVNGKMARLMNPTALYARVRVLIVSHQPGIVFASWLSATGGPVGLGSGPNQIFTGTAA